MTGHRSLLCDPSPRIEIPLAGQQQEVVSGLDGNFDLEN